MAKKAPGAASTAAPTVPKSKTGRNLANFVVNRDNTLMSEAYTPGATPFDSGGPLPQRQVDTLLSRVKTAKRSQAQASVASR